MKVKVLTWEKEVVGEIVLNQSIFGCAERKDILHQVVNWQLARRREGTHQTKGRSDVQGSTRKIYRQKGTGRARHGGIRAPQFRGGGIVFGPHVRDHSYKLNKKLRALALRIALSVKMQRNELTIVGELEMQNAKTSVMQTKLKGFAAKSILIVDDVLPNDVKLATRNLIGVDVLPVCGLNVYDILRHEQLILSAKAVKAIEERLK
ncbi:MAG: 50S ribosomal protein L4 [Proteobacteria bacterium]|nr:50S ribosomal protein L4 [Pseudomonadota bacterium]